MFSSLAFRSLAWESRRPGSSSLVQGVFPPDRQTSLPGAVCCKVAWHKTSLCSICCHSKWCWSRDTPSLELPNHTIQLHLIGLISYPSPIIPPLDVSPPETPVGCSRTELPSRSSGTFIQGSSRHKIFLLVSFFVCFALEFLWVSLLTVLCHLDTSTYLLSLSPCHFFLQPVGTHLRHLSAAEVPEKVCV